jgi:hypothetical protein
MARAITIQILGDAKEFTKATEAATRASDGFSNTMKHITEAGVVAGGAIAAFGVAAVEKTAAAGQAAYEMSEKFGILPGVASQWLTVARQLGIESDTIGTGFKFLDKHVGNMAITLQAGGKVAAATLEPFKVLGLNVFDLHGKLKDANEIMLESADIFAKMPDGAVKTALAIQLFGRSGADMLPILNQGQAGIQAMIDKGKQMGDVLSGRQVAAAHKFTLEQNKLNTEISGFTTQVGITLMPLATRFLTWLTETAPQLRKVVDIFAALKPYLIEIGVAWVAWNAAMAISKSIAMITFLTQLIAQSYIAASATRGMSVAQWLLNVAMDANPIGAVIVAIGLLVAGFIFAYTHIKPFRDFINALWDDLRGFWNFLTSHIGPELGKLGKLFGDLGKGNWLSLPGDVSALASFDTPGVVGGAYGSPQLVMARGGEQFGGFPPGRSGMTVYNSIHIDGIYAGDGPSLDILANKIAQRLSYTTGR